MKRITIYPNGSQIVTGDDEQLSDSKLKEIGLPYDLNGEIYQVPLDEDTQNLVAVLTTGYLAAAFTGTLSDATIDTIMHLSNGIEMPIKTKDWMSFAEWFKNERNKFFKKEETNV